MTVIVCIGDSVVSRFLHEYSHILGNILHKLQHCYDQADIEELFSYGLLTQNALAIDKREWVPTTLSVVSRP